MPVITSPEWSGSEHGGRRYSPFTINVERLKPWHTLTGRQHFYLDHDWMHELGEALPVFRPPLDMHQLFGEPRLGRNGELELTVRYLTPHSKWSIHSEYQDNLHHAHAVARRPDDVDERGRRGEDRRDATTTGSRRSTATASSSCRAVVTHKMPEGTVYMYHAQERVVDVPKARDVGPPRRHPQLADPAADQAEPPHRRVRPAVVRVQLPRPDRQPARRGHRHPPPLPGGRVLDATCMAQMAMVMNLDKCIGCHTCSVTCKQAWTNRSGVEYVWFNNVESRPGQGYPRTYQDQERWQGGWTRTKRGPAQARARVAG